MKKVWGEDEEGGGGGLGVVLPHLPCEILEACSFCASFFPSFFPLPTVPFLPEFPPPSSDLKTPPFPRGNAIFRGWGAARLLEGVTPQKKKKGISLKNGARKLVSRSLLFGNCSDFPPYSLGLSVNFRRLQSLSVTFTHIQSLSIIFYQFQILSSTLAQSKTQEFIPKVSKRCFGLVDGFCPRILTTLWAQHSEKKRLENIVSYSLVCDAPNPNFIQNSSWRLFLRVPVKGTEFVKNQSKF